MQFYIHQSGVVAWLLSLLHDDRLSIALPCLTLAPKLTLHAWCSTVHGTHWTRMLCCCLGSHHAKPSKNTTCVLGRAVVLHIAKQGSCRFCCIVTGNFTVCICVSNLLEQGLLFSPSTTFLTPILFLKIASLSLH